MRLIMQVTGKPKIMENHKVAIGSRVCAVAIAFALSAMTGNAQVLLNGGFESGTPPTPDSWNSFNSSFMTGTNCPPDGNNTCTNLTVHGGAYSLKTYGPFNVDFDASGVYQDLAGASVGQTWKLAGYALNWSGGGETLSGSNGWGVAQIQFRDSTNGLIQVAESAHFGTDTPLPLDQWTAFQAVGTVPAGTVTMRIQLLHVGMAGAGGSVWWDDVTLTQRTGVTNTIAAATQSGVQVKFPTRLGASYQVQTTTNLTTSTVWANFGSMIIGSSYTNQVFDTYGSAQRKFYKILPQ